MANGYPIRLYDNGGQHVGDAMADVDLSVAANRDYVIDSGGKIYVYNARNDQWRESIGVITLGKGEKAAEAEAETKKATDKDK